MTGSMAEKNLLGSLLVDSRLYRSTMSLVSADDFEDPRLGVIYAGIGQMVSRGLPVSVDLVHNRLAEWEVRNLGTELFEWDLASVYVHAAPDYARAVRSDSLRRRVGGALTDARTALVEGVAPSEVASSALTAIGSIVDGAVSGELATKTLGEILDGSDEYDWLIPNLIERQDRLVVTGPEGSGKTTWVRQLAVLSAAGIHPTTFAPIEPVKVLVVDAENTERQWRRAVRWTTERARESGRADPTATVNITAGNRIDVTRGSHLGEIHRLIDQHKPDMLFIGPLYKLVRGAINNDDDAAPLIVALDSLRERGLALVMEAHAGKAAGADGSRDLRPRGSAALLGWPEFGLGLRPDPDMPNTVEVVRWRGDRDVREWPRRMYRGQEWPWMPTL